MTSDSRARTPDTRLIVDVSHVFGDKPRIELPWRLWGGRDFGEVEALESVSPQMVASEVSMQVDEYCYT